MLESCDRAVLQQLVVVAAAVGHVAAAAEEADQTEAVHTAAVEEDILDIHMAAAAEVAVEVVAVDSCILLAAGILLAVAAVEDIPLAAVAVAAADCEHSHSLGLVDIHCWVDNSVAVVADSCNPVVVAACLED